MRDYGASARDRLKAIAATKEESYQQILFRYASERFLYRLSISEHRDRCILKGGCLLGLWMAEPYRSTRDLDLLARGPRDEASIRELIASICSLPCPEDGLSFDLGSLRVEEIREAAEYQGQRALIDARLGRAIIHLQIDLGFGDAVEPVVEEYPVILADLPKPRLRAYPRDYVVAEKFEAMISLGLRNSRMKDFHDFWALSGQFRFVLGSLAAALSNCLERRGIAFPDELPEVLRPSFYQDETLTTRWRAYRAKEPIRTPPPASFSEVGAALVPFLAPLYSAARNDGPCPQQRWEPGGPWR